MYNLEKMQQDFYNERIGKKYGMFEVIDVEYDAVLKKQKWIMRCVKCGAIRTTYNGRDYVKGRNSGKCECSYKKAERKDKFDPNTLVGTVSGDWIVEKYVRGSGLYCRCSLCGEHSYRGIKPIMENRANRCICTANKKKYIESEWIGKKYGNLTIMGYKNKHFHCKCDCGRETDVKPTHLINGKQITCGDEDCFWHKVMQSANGSKHGCSDTRLYRVWASMRNRCNNPNSESYNNYGGRGIKICKEWDDFEVFQDWAMSAGYNCTQKHGECTIDRIDVNGNYEPSNCRWVDMKVQANNRRPFEKALIEIDGEVKTKEEWCKEYGFTTAAIYYRMKKYDLSFQQAIKIPKHQGNPLKNSTGEKQ